MHRVSITSGRLRLVGYVLKPPGDGPFPAVVWNHGWGPRMDRYWPYYGVIPGSQCMSIVEEQRWTYLLLERRGYGDSEGESIQEYDARVQRSFKGEALAYALAQRAWQEADDVIAATAYLKRQPYINPARVAVSGYSLGGVVSIFAATRAPNEYVAVVNQAGGLGGWSLANDIAIQEVVRVGGPRAPILIQHGLEDASVSVVISHRFAVALRGLGRDVTTRYYKGGHNIFDRQPIGEWGDDFVEFLRGKFNR